MERDTSYDELITPQPGKGTVLVLQGAGSMNSYEGQLGVSFDISPERLVQLDPLDGPIRLEQWGAGGGMAYDGAKGDNPAADPTCVPTSDGGTHLYGLMPDGRRVFTAPLTEIIQFGGSPLGFVVDGLVFELGVPDPAWVQAAEDEGEYTAVENFVRSFAPLSLTRKSSCGGAQ